MQRRVATISEFPLTAIKCVGKLSKRRNNNTLQKIGGVAQVVRAYGSYP